MARKNTPQNRNRLRIIGGRWRGRRLGFPDAEGLRPTPDRVRETLFNWLQPVIATARCLDLFAGSGALGLEALSRGAARCTFIERDPVVVAALRENAAMLDAGQSCEVVQADALAWLAGPASCFDIVFVDPPFRRGLAGPCLNALLDGGWLAPGARVYLECAADEAPGMPSELALVREKRAGQVVSRLFALQASTA